VTDPGPFLDPDHILDPDPFLGSEPGSGFLTTELDSVLNPGEARSGYFSTAYQALYRIWDPY